MCIWTTIYITYYLLHNTSMLHLCKNITSCWPPPPPRLTLALALIAKTHFFCRPSSVFPPPRLPISRRTSILASSTHLCNLFLNCATPFLFHSARDFTALPPPQIQSQWKKWSGKIKKKNGLMIDWLIHMNWYLCSIYYTHLLYIKKKKRENHIYKYFIKELIQNYKKVNLDQ